MSDELLAHDLVGIATAMRNGEVSAEKIARLCIERMERLGRTFNAVVRIDEEPALEAARAADLARAAGASLGA
jgi:Asp-tRNA(Asn)/Glu-tRNA(Gln) amidotransferase A subunit family amidase